jgi:hypothetical protein
MNNRSIVLVLIQRRLNQLKELKIERGQRKDCEGCI